MTFPRGLTEAVTHWTVAPDGFGGFVFGAPAALLGRWEDRSERFMNEAGQEDISRAIVHIDADVSPGDYLFQGTSTVSTPLGLSEAHPVKRFDKVPDLRFIETVRKAFL